MKEREPQPIEELSLEELITMDELLYLYEADGYDVEDIKDKVWEAVNKLTNE